MQLFEFDVTQAFLSIQMEQLEKNIIAITVPDGKVFFLGTQRIAIMVQDIIFFEENYSPMSVHRKNNVFISGAFDALKQIYSIKEERPISALGNFIENLIEKNIIVHNNEFNMKQDLTPQTQNENVPPVQEDPPVQIQNESGPPVQQETEKEIGPHHTPLPPGFNRDTNLPIPPPKAENENQPEKKVKSKEPKKVSAKKTVRKTVEKKVVKKDAAKKTARKPDSKK